MSRHSRRVQLLDFLHGISADVGVQTVACGIHAYHQRSKALSLQLPDRFRHPHVQPFHASDACNAFRKQSCTAGCRLQVDIFIFLTGCILYIGEWASEKKQVKTDKVDLKTAIIIGLAQGIASIPGISRSGSTISTGILLGLDRVTCARYSFLLSLPIIIGASIFYPILELELNEFLNFNWIAFIVGFFISFVSGYFCIKYFLKFLAKHSMKVFAYYCWIAGAFMFVFFKFFI